MERANKSKIGRLPWKVRDRLNEMLRDGVRGAKILVWLNTHVKPPDAPITAPNLSDWRKTGYRAWLEDRKKTDYLRDFSELSQSIAKATGGNPAGVAARLITEQVLKAVAKLAEKGDADPELLGQLTKVVTLLNSSEAEARKLELQMQRLEVKEEELRLNKRKFKTQCVRQFLKWMQNQEIVGIAKGGASNEDKIAAILKHMDKEEDEGDGEDEG